MKRLALAIVVLISICLCAPAVMAGQVEFKFAHFINPIEPGP